MEAEQVEQFSTQTLTKTWTDPGTGNVVDPGTVSVGVVRADGSVVAAPGSPTTGGGAAARSYLLTASATDRLDWLYVTWTSSAYGSRRPDVIEVVGGFLFSLADARAVLPSATTTELRDARAYAEAKLEAAVGYALVPRYNRESLIVRRRPILPRRPFVRLIRSLTIDGAAIPAADVVPTAAGLSLGPYLGGGARGFSQVTVAYEHGLDAPPPEAARAALELCGDAAGEETGIDARATSVTTPDGSFTLAPGGGLPITEAFVAAHRLPLVA